MSIHESYNLLWAIEELINAKLMDARQSHEMGYESYRVERARNDLRAQIESLFKEQR